jgi:hypothetical protein
VLVSGVSKMTLLIYKENKVVCRKSIYETLIKRFHVYKLYIYKAS